LDSKEQPPPPPPDSVIVPIPWSTATAAWVELKRLIKKVSSGSEEPSELTVT
jgi:hypothetical protein